MAQIAQQMNDMDSVNAWYMRKLYGVDDNNNQNRERNEEVVSTSSDDMVLQVFRGKDSVMNWKSFLDAHREVCGRAFHLTTQSEVEEHLEGVPGIEVRYVLDGDKYFAVLDILRSRRAHHDSTTFSYYTADNSSIGAQTAIEFDAMVGDDDEVDCEIFDA